MDWEEEYKKKLVSAEEAVRAVKSGDRVVFSHGAEPANIAEALAARKDELRNVTIFVLMPRRHLGWYEPGWEDSFSIEVGVIVPEVKKMFQEKRCDLSIASAHFSHWLEGKRPDVLITELSPPDSKGFCSFGAWVWNKKAEIRSARTAIAAVNKNLIRTYGDNFIHVSEIDCFVEHTPSGRAPGVKDLLGRDEVEPDETAKQIAEHISTIIKDGDTIQIGIGTVTEFLPMLGVFDDKLDLGWHSEATPRGIVKLVKEGVFTGKRKTIHTGKAVATMFGGLPKEDLDYVNENPLFELYSADYVIDIRTISAHENMVAINSALSVDITGQVSAESKGPVVVSGAGGQPAFAIGATLSKGGRSITAFRSTTSSGSSRIVPMLETGTIVTLPRTVTDIVVTEYGIARLRGKTQRRRAEELIAIAHPDFRVELWKEAKKLYWP